MYFAPFRDKLGYILSLLKYFNLFSPWHSDICTIVLTSLLVLSSKLLHALHILMCLDFSKYSLFSLLCILFMLRLLVAIFYICHWRNLSLTLLYIGRKMGRGKGGRKCGKQRREEMRSFLRKGAPIANTCNRL